MRAVRPCFPAHSDAAALLFLAVALFLAGGVLTSAKGLSTEETARALIEKNAHTPSSNARALACGGGGNRTYHFSGRVKVEGKPLEGVQIRVVRKGSPLKWAQGPDVTTGPNGTFSVSCNFARDRNGAQEYGRKIRFQLRARLRNEDFKVRKGGWFKNNWLTIADVRGCRRSFKERLPLIDADNIPACKDYRKTNLRKNFDTDTKAGKLAHIWWFYNAVQNELEAEGVGLTDRPFFNKKLTIAYPNKNIIKDGSFFLFNIHLAKDDWNDSRTLLDAFMHRWDIGKLGGEGHISCLLDAHRKSPDQWNSSRCSGFMEGFAQASAAALDRALFGAPFSPHPTADLRSGTGVDHTVADRQAAERSHVGWANFLKLILADDEMTYAQGDGSCSPTDVGIFEMLRALQDDAARKANWSDLRPNATFPWFTGILETHLSHFTPADGAIYQNLGDPSPTSASCAEVDGIADIHLHQTASYGFGSMWYWPDPDAPLPSTDPTYNDGFLKPDNLSEFHKHAVPDSVVPEGHSTIQHGPPGTESLDRWPLYNDIAHQQAHTTWLKDAHDEGLNLIVVSTVNFEPLCHLLTLLHEQRHKVKCRDMPSVERQIEAAKQMADNHSWYRIALDPWHARDIINDGDLAVILSMEVSHPLPKRNFTKQLDRFHEMGLRSLQLAHETNSRFAGAAPHRKIFEYLAELKQITEGKVGEEYEVGFETDDYGNLKGLTQRGERLLGAMVDRHMLIDVAHLSKRSVDDVYGEVGTNHSFYPIYDSHTRLDSIMPGPLLDKQREFLTTCKQAQYIERTGGMVGLRTALDSLKKADYGRVPNTCHGSSMSYAQLVNFTTTKTGLPIAFGSDLNGVAAQVGPRFGPQSCPRGTASTDGSPPPNRVSGEGPPPKSPFKTVGLSHVGYLPDLLDDLNHLEANTGRLEDSAESFLRMWERTYDEQRTKQDADTECPYELISELPDAAQQWVGTYQGRNDGRRARLTIEHGSDRTRLHVIYEDLDRGTRLTGSVNATQFDQSATHILEDLELTSDGCSLAYEDCTRKTISRLFLHNDADYISGYSRWNGESYGMAFSADDISTETAPGDRFDASSGFDEWSQWIGEYRGRQDGRRVRLTIKHSNLLSLRITLEGLDRDTRFTGQVRKTTQSSSPPHILTDLTLTAPDGGTKQIERLALHTWNTNYISGHSRWRGTDYGTYYVRTATEAAPGENGSFSEDLYRSVTAAQELEAAYEAAQAVPTVETILDQTDTSTCPFGTGRCTDDDSFPLSESALSEASYGAPSAGCADQLGRLFWVIGTADTSTELHGALDDFQRRRTQQTGHQQCSMRALSGPVNDERGPSYGLVDTAVEVVRATHATFGDGRWLPSQSAASLSDTARASGTGPAELGLRGFLTVLVTAGDDISDEERTALAFDGATYGGLLGAFHDRWTARAGGDPGSPDESQWSPEAPGGVTITLMPKAGAFLSGVSSVGDISGEAGATLGGEQSVFTWGGSVAFGGRDGPVNLRLTGLRTTGSLVSTTEGVNAPGAPIPQRLLLLTGDLVLRPLPRFLVQPYVIGGVGGRRLSVGGTDASSASSPWSTTAQVGVGVDLQLGGLTLGVEIVDYLTRGGETGDGLQHDAFAFLTLGVPLN